MEILLHRMITDRRLIRRIAAAMAVAVALPTAADAQVAGYPTKPVRVIGPFAPGGPVEVLARVVTQRLAESMGQPFIIDNRGGASGTIGTDLVAKAPRDGYTMLITNCSHSSNPAYYRKLPYDPIGDFQPITQIDVTSGNLLVVHPSVPAHSVKEFIALAKTRPGQLKYASAGIGSPQHVTGALFAAMAGIELTHVPYKGNPPALADVVGGHVELMYVTHAAARPFMEAKRLRALGIAGPRRLPSLPDLPTFNEAGVPGYDYTCYHGMWFPARVPADILRRMHAEAVKAIGTPEVRNFLADSDYFPVAGTPEQFLEFLKKDVPRQISIAKKVGIQPQ